MANQLRVLIVVTNHGHIEGVPKTGVWFSEFTEPFNFFVKEGVHLTVASLLGGPAPVDPRGYPSKDQIVDVRDALERLNATAPLATLRVEDFDGLFFPGGHGPMFDLSVAAAAKKTIAGFWEADKPVSAVCHGPAALLDVVLEGGVTLLKDKRVTGFTRGEDQADALFQYMPFSLQDRMTKEGAKFIEMPPKTMHVVVDGRLVTGQNPVSALATAEAFLKVLRGENA